MANITPTYWTDLRKKRPHLAKKKVLFHQDNARVHMCVVSMAKFHELRYELHTHPPYSISCFRTLRNGLAERHFISTIKSSHKLIHIFEDLEKSYFLEGIQKLVKGWTKGIELKGDYIEK